MNASCWFIFCSYSSTGSQGDSNLLAKHDLFHIRRLSHRGHPRQRHKLPVRFHMGVGRGAAQPPDVDVTQRHVSDVTGEANDGR